MAILEWKDLRLEDKPLFDKYSDCDPPEISELTFTNLFIWRKPREHQYAEYDEHLVVSLEKEGNRCCYQPIGCRPAQVIRKLLGKDPSMCFERVDSETAKQLEGEFYIERLRDHDDYVYDVSDLRELQGDKYRAKRNFVNRVEKLNPDVKEIMTGNLGEVREFMIRWCRLKACKLHKGLHEEHGAVDEALEYFGDLGMFGVVVLIDGKIEALAIGERLNKTTFVEHFEKANSDFPGMYQYVLREFSRRIPEKYKYLNREQDLGIKGLRKSKESYHPHHMTEKYLVKARN